MSQLPLQGFSFKHRTMLSYFESEIPAHIPDADKELILLANRQSWEEIDADKATTPEARAILHDIASTKYHRDEYRCGME